MLYGIALYQLTYVVLGRLLPVEVQKKHEAQMQKCRNAERRKYKNVDSVTEREFGHLVRRLSVINLTYVQ